MKTQILKLWIIVLAFFVCSCTDDDSDVDTPEEFTLSFNVETNQDQMGDFSHNKLAVFNGEVWSVGGYNSYNIDILNSDVWKSANGRNWQSVTSGQFESRRDHSLLVFDNKLWVIGGRTESGTSSLAGLNDVWYSSDGTNWTMATDNALPSMWIGENTTVVFNNKMYIIKNGVSEGNNNVCTVWTSSDGVTWTQESSNAFPYRNGFTTTVFNDEIYVIGGSDITLDVQYNTIYKSEDGINWTEVNTTGNVFTARYLHKSLVYDNKLWVFGGLDNISAIGKGLFYTENGTRWYSYEPLPSEDGIYSFDALNYNDSIWVFGGMHQDDTTFTYSRVGTINTITKD